MAERKHLKYTLLIEYLNGDKEEINFKQQEVDNTSYKEMLEIYKEYKEEYKDKCAKIHFVGINETNELNVLFTKEFKNEETKQKEYASIVENTRIKDIVLDIQRYNKLYEDRISYIEQRIGAIEKQKSDVLHVIENKNNPDEKDIVELYKELYGIIKERRAVKTDLKYVENAGSIINNVQLNQLVRKIDKIEKSEFNDMQTAEDREKIYKEYTYRNNKEKLYLINKYKKDYDKVTVKESESKIIFYKKGYSK